MNENQLLQVYLGIKKSVFISLVCPDLIVHNNVKWDKYYL